jgi:DMSO/TMAO reductase YedYZ heme-binding membrane subunit
MTGRAFPLVLATIASFGAVALGLAVGDGIDQQWLLAARWTARVGFPVFILTYCAASLVRLWPNAMTRAMLRYRRQWGLGFALTHSVHLFALVTFLEVSGQPPKLLSVIGGGAGYALLYAMALTSNTASMRAMGIWWKRLHAVGMHWLWFVFTFSYFGRIFDPGRMAQGLTLFPICIAALGLRLWARTKARQKQVVA